MPPDRRLLREIKSAYKGMKRYQIEAGQWVAWFRFNNVDTTSHPVYDTGPQRKWYSSISIPCQIGEYARAGRNFDDDGLYLVDRIHIIMSYDAFFHAMSYLPSSLQDPDPTGRDHLTDRLGYDGRLFSVASFIPRGRVADQFLTISIDAIEVAAEELREDVADPLFAQYVVAT